MSRLGLFPSRLRQLLTSANVTQKQLAEVIGVKPQSISQYVDGAASPSYAALIKIADFFHVSTDYLVGRTDVSTDDMSISAIGNTLGLSEKAVSFIASNSTAVERLLSSEETEEFFNAVKCYHSYTIPPKNKELLGGRNAILSRFVLQDASYKLGEIFRGKEGEKSMLVPMEVEVIHGDPPPLQDDEVELVFETDEKTPSADELERMIVEKILKRIKDRGFIDG